MDDLIAFVRAQLDEDERVARQAFGDHNDAIATWCVQSTGIVELGPREGDLVINDRDVAYHIERWDPARVLAEVEAKRRILDELAMWLAGHDEERAHEFPGTTAGVAALLTAVRQLAQPYAGRPGWREEWAT